MTQLLNDFLSGSAAWGVLLTLAAFALGTLINRVTGKAIFNPLLLGSIFVIIFLSVCSIPYADYKASAAPVNYLLLPATVALAIPLYEKIDLLKENAAAVRVSHDDDVAHVEVLHGVFDGGDDRIMFACLLDIGNDRGNASGDEEVARTAPHQNGGVDARVATGHDERLRTLAVDEAAEEFALAEEVVFLEVVEVLNQFVKILHGWCTE